MASIVQRIIRSETEKRLVLTAEQCGRVLEVGSNWSKLRIGGRISSTRYSNWSSPPSFNIGLSAGTSNMVGDATPQHFLGVRTNSVGWIYSPSGTEGGALETNLSTVRIVNGVVTATGIGHQTNVYTANRPSIACAYDNGNSTQVISAIFIEITKGSPNFNVKVWSNVIGSVSNTRVAQHVTAARFNDAMSAEAIPEGNGNWIAIGNTDYAIDEATNGYFNALNIAWLGTGSSFEISDAAAWKLA